MKLSNPYFHSIAEEKLPKNLRIAFLDVDETLTYPQDRTLQSQIRKRLDSLGFVTSFVSSRPHELMMSDSALFSSRTINLLPSKMRTVESGQQTHIDLSQIEEFQGLLDPDFIAGSTGVRIFVKQKNGSYYEDKDYHQLPHDYKHWRHTIFHTINIIKDSVDFIIHSHEKEENYLSHRAPHAPLPYRIQVDFDSLSKKNLFIKYFKKRFDASIPAFIADDSKPTHNVYSIYIFPVPAKDLKAQATNHIVKQIEDYLEIQSRNLNVLISGDSLTDLSMGLEGARGTNALFFLPGGSRLLPLFQKNLFSFAGQRISFLKNISKIDDGIYLYRKRKIFLGDILFPEKSAGESFLQFLHSSHLKNLLLG